jgi:hypothetical protein
MMPAHQITRDGHCTVLKTTVQHSPEFWRMISDLFAADEHIDLRDPLGVTTEIEFGHARTRAMQAISEYAATIAPGSGGNLSAAYRAHLDRIRFEAADKAETKWVA